MIVKDETLLAEFRTAGKCGWCRKPCRLREPHHLFARGFGGGGRLDVRFNLIALGSSLTFQCPCHAAHHAGNEPLRHDLLTAIAQREGVLQDDVLDAVYLLRRLPRGASPERLKRELDSLTPAAAGLVRQALKL